MNHSESVNKRPVGDINSKSAEEIVSRLNGLLADEFGLFTKTLNYHWNITGPRFHSLHTFLEGQYNELLEVMDNVAERVRILGDAPLSTVSEMSKKMHLEEKNGENLSSNEMISDLLHSSHLIQEEIKRTINQDKAFSEDPGTEDLLVGILRKHEKNSWMLKSHLD
jgi:starvation-inducible DNA-binding protein